MQKWSAKEPDYIKINN